MNLTRRTVHRIALCAVGAAVSPAFALELRQGRDFALLSPAQPGGAPGRIEVREFFSYGCPHCAQLHPLVTRWAAALPKDVVLQRVPVSFGRAAWASLARLYLALDSIGESGRLDPIVFDALHRQRSKLFTDAAIVDWVAAQGIDRARFRAAYDSFGVRSAASRSEQLTRDYKVQSVPLLTVDGRFAVTGEAARDYADLIAIADALVARVRAERPARAR